LAIKEIGGPADKDRMTISGAYGPTILDNLANGEAADTQVQVALLKKAQDQMKQQGEAMVRMIDQTPTGGDEFHLDVYA
jgi:hypothetical protein